jgi:hypothetical protein
LEEQIKDETRSHVKTGGFVAQESGFSADFNFIVEMTDVTDNGLVFHLLYVLLKRSFEVVFEDQVERR